MVAKLEESTMLPSKLLTLLYLNKLRENLANRINVRTELIKHVKSQDIFLNYVKEND